MPKRRSWGTIKHVSKDKHVIRYIDAQGARKSVTFYGTRREAEAELARLRLMHERNPARRKPPTVKQAAEAWWLPWLERGACGRLHVQEHQLHVLIGMEEARGAAMGRRAP